MIDKDSIVSLLSQYQDHFLEKNLLEAKCVKAIEIENDHLRLDLELGYPAKSSHAGLKSALFAALSSYLKPEQITINIITKITAHRVQTGVKGLPNIKNIIAVASGKGGVGKSTTAVNLALALHQEGAKVGILDADIYGPSQPQMLGSYEKPKTNEQNLLLPIVLHGIESMSIGYLIDQDKAVVWRGPMVSGALTQLLNDTQWQDLDYLIVDLPPGTGDVQLTLCQKIPLTGAIIVTTPQDLALLDARRAIAMFQKVLVPVLGIVENMSVYTCTQCGYQAHLFGEGGAMRIAAQYKLPLLGMLPLDNQIRIEADRGTPTVVADPAGKIAGIYREIACKMAAKLSLEAKNSAHRFPKIVVENN